MVERLHRHAGPDFASQAQHGLTLPELLIGLAIISTVSLGASSSLSRLTQTPARVCVHYINHPHTFVVTTTAPSITSRSRAKASATGTLITNRATSKVIART